MGGRPRVADRPSAGISGCFVANPLLDTDLTISCLRQLVAKSRFRMVKFHPTLHGYIPFRVRDRIEPVLREIAQLGIPVMFHQGDPPFGHPTQVTGMMEAHRDVTFILAHFATQCAVMADEAIYVARMNPNVILESSWVDLPRVKGRRRGLGAERIVFGSDYCPVQEMSLQLRTLEVLGGDLPTRGAARASLQRQHDEAASVSWQHVAARELEDQRQRSGSIPRPSGFGAPLETPQMLPCSIAIARGCMDRMRWLRGDSVRSDR